MPSDVFLTGDVSSATAGRTLPLIVKTLLDSLALEVMVTVL
jgi:hypothetical protein